MVSVYEWVSYDSIWADVDSIWVDSEPDFHTGRTQGTHPFALITHHHPPTSSSQRLSLINSMLEKRGHRRRWLKASNRWSVTFKIWSLDILLKYLVGTYRLCRPSGLLLCLHTSQNLTWLLIWRILFRQASCARAAECRIADCLSLSWLQSQDLNCLLDLACCLIWIVAWFVLLLWKNIDKQTCSCLGMCASSGHSEL